MSIFELQTNGIYVHTDDATGLEGFQEVLGCCHCDNNKEHMAKVIDSELRGSEESGDEEAMNMSKPQVRHTKRQKNQLWPAAMETHNSWNSLSAEKAYETNRNHYVDELPPLNSPTDSESNTEIDNITNEEVWSSLFIMTFCSKLTCVC